MCGFAGGPDECATAALLLARQISHRCEGISFACGAGVMSAIFNVGYSLALPIADAGRETGVEPLRCNERYLAADAGRWFDSKHCLLPLPNGSAHTAGLFLDSQPSRTWGLSIVMGLLWGASIFLYGAATDLLAISALRRMAFESGAALLVANGLGVLLKEWRSAPSPAIRSMQWVWEFYSSRLSSVVCRGKLVTR